LDAQIKKGLIEICVLAVLCRGESYGYQIIKDVGDVIEVSESTLYPVLKRLENANMVRTREVAHNGRLRKYFKITGSGTGRLRQFEYEQQELMRIYKFISASISIKEKEE
jgi:PadR family transcriptional regulator PadR